MSKEVMEFWGGTVYIKSEAYRMIVGANSALEAREIAGVTKSEFRKYWAKTRNDLEMMVCRDFPLQAHLAPLSEPDQRTLRNIYAGKK